MYIIWKTNILNYVSFNFMSNTWIHSLREKLKHYKQAKVPTHSLPRGHHYYKRNFYFSWSIFKSSGWGWLLGEVWSPLYDKPLPLGAGQSWCEGHEDNLLLRVCVCGVSPYSPLVHQAWGGAPLESCGRGADTGPSPGFSQPPSQPGSF